MLSLLLRRFSGDQPRARNCPTAYFSAVAARRHHRRSATRRTFGH
jgi:hypothetical protein